MTYEDHIKIQAEALAHRWQDAEATIEAENSAAKVLRSHLGDNFPVWEVNLPSCTRCFLSESSANDAAQEVLNREDQGHSALDFKIKKRQYSPEEKRLPNIDRRRYYPPTIFTDNCDLVSQF